MPTKIPEPSSDNQAPIVPPTAKVASNQKIQIGRLFMADCPLCEEWRQTTEEMLSRVKSAELAATSDTAVRSKGGKVAVNQRTAQQKGPADGPF